MAISADRIRAIQSDMGARIDAISHALPHCALAQLVEEIDGIRRIADDYGFNAVACLASTLESAIARGGRQATILCYLDAMSDATGLSPGMVPPPQQEALLASVALRLHG